MTISVTILGSGTCVPSLQRSSSAVLMEINDTKMLFDCGPGTMHRLLSTETTIFEVAFIFLSHFHPDHSAELVPFLFSNKYIGGTLRQHPLTIVAGKGFSDFYNKLRMVYNGWIELPPERLNIIEMDNQSYDVRNFEHFTVASSPVDHNPESIAYRINAGNESVVYSGDTDFTESLITLSENADLLICESALPDDLKVRGHLTPSLAGEIADRAKVRKLVLTHFYPECEQADIEKECRKRYDGELLLAKDLMKISGVQKRA